VRPTPGQELTFTSWAAQHRCNVSSLKLQAWGARAAKGKGDSSSCDCADPSVIREVGIKQFSTFHDRPVIMLAPAAGKKLRAAQHGMLMATGAYWGSIRAAAQPLFHAARFEMQHASQSSKGDTTCVPDHVPRHIQQSADRNAADRACRSLICRLHALTLHDVMTVSHRAFMIPAAWHRSCRA